MMRGFLLGLLFLLGVWGGAALAIQQFKQSASVHVERLSRQIP